MQFKIQSFNDFFFFFVFPDKLDLVSQELVKLAKDNGSSDNITIVVVFLKPIDELVAMELPIDTKDTLDTTNNMNMNNNEKEVLYDGITSTSIYVGKDSIEVGEESMDEDEISRKVSSSSGEDSAIGSDLKPSNPFASPDGGFGFGEVVNPFDGMTGKNHSEIPAVDEVDSFEGRNILFLIASQRTILIS